MSNYTVWIIGRREYGSEQWVEQDRLSGRGMQIEALRRVRDGYYAKGAQYLVFTPAQWREEQKTQAPR